MRIATTISFLAAIAAVVVDAAPNNLAVTVSCQKQYIVQANDKCYKIAAAYNIYASQLLKWNPQGKNDR
jgi:LysM repeat protein